MDCRVEASATEEDATLERMRELTRGNGTDFVNMLVVRSVACYSHSYDLFCENSPASQ